jgi:hypothetical protein
MSYERPSLLCVGCNKKPEEIQEMIDMAEAEEYDTPSDFVWENEGTLNTQNGHFLCTDCYIKAGMPSSPTGWKAP